MLGWGFDYVDRLVYVYWQRPHEHLSEQVRHFLRERRFREGLLLLDRRSSEQVMLSLRSVLFLVAWVPMSFFVLSSTSAVIGWGLVLALGFAASCFDLIGMAFWR